MIAREVAWRIFAGELNDSSLDVTGDEERAPTYIITPLGAKVNRVYIVGVVTDLENIGSTEEPLWKAKIIDPTGTIRISAGQFQPEAAAAMSKLTVPGFAAIIGKIRIYRPDEGGMYISIRPEVVKAVEKSVRNAWVMDGCVALRQRLDAVSEAMQNGDMTADDLVKLGYSQNLADGIIMAREHYGNVPLEKYQSMLVDALRYLIPEEGGDSDIPESAYRDEQPAEDDYEELEESIDMPPIPPPAIEEEMDKVKIDTDEELTEDEEKILKAIARDDPKSDGMDWEALAKAMKKAGMKNEAFETAMDTLLDKGLIYEPMLGKIRKI